MAYDKDNRKLYTTTDSSGKKIGISLWEIYDCLRYNKVDQRGNRNLGMVIKNGNINNDSLFRPYKTSKAVLGEGVFKNGGEDGLYGYIIPYTENNTVSDLWRQTWSHKARPDQYYKQDMFDGYWHLASFDNYPFGIKRIQAGSNVVFDYYCDAEAVGSVNPSHMEIFKTYYPALMIFEEETSGQPKTIPTYSWCGSRPLGEGVSGMEPTDMGLVNGKTYYIIPFLSQYKFTSKQGDLGTLTGKKYCLIYKNWNINDWTIIIGGEVRPVINMYISLVKVSDTALMATFTYEFLSDAYVAPTYWYEVYNSNGQKVYTSTIASITSSFQGQANETYSWQVSIPTVNPDTGQPWASGYIIRVWHKEQTSATGSTAEFYEDYIMP